MITKYMKNFIALKSLPVEQQMELAALYGHPDEVQSTDSVRVCERFLEIVSPSGASAIGSMLPRRVTRGLNAQRYRQLVLEGVLPREVSAQWIENKLYQLLTLRFAGQREKAHFQKRYNLSYTAKLIASELKEAAGGTAVLPLGQNS